eukprot:11324160-Alexandrium_andersonii.AAC.1
MGRKRGSAVLEHACAAHSGVERRNLQQLRVQISNRCSYLRRGGGGEELAQLEAEGNRISSLLAG